MEIKYLRSSSMGDGQAVTRLFILIEKVFFNREALNCHRATEALPCGPGP